MILSILVLILVLGIAFFHYTQGFFSATISAILAIIAAAFALSLHETIVESLLAGKAANLAHGMILLLLFAVIYLGLRMLFDSLIPGQIRLPVLVDKIGGAIMGIVAGIFATGIVMIAVQEFPLGPTFLGYARYDTEGDRPVVVPHGAGHQSETVDIYDEIKSEQPGVFDDNTKRTLYVDDIVVNTVAWLSNGGSLAGSQPLAAIHPDFLQELFGQRLGIEPGGKGVALNLDKQQIHDVKVDGLFSLGPVTQADSEIPKFRPAFTEKAKGTLKAPPDSILLAVRVAFSRTAADTDGLVRVSPGAVRLVAPTDAEATHFADYYPLGTLQGADLLFLNKLDDPIFLSVSTADQAADFVFMVKKDGFADATKPSAMKVQPGVFLEVKRLARVDLSGMAIKAPFVESPEVAVLRKTLVAPAAPPAPPAVAVGPTPTPTPAPPPTPAPGPAPAPSPSPAPAPTPAPPVTSLHSPQAIVATTANAVFELKDAIASSSLPFAIAIGNDASHLNRDLPGGSCIPKNDKFLSLNLDAQAPQDKLSTGDHPLKDLLAPDGQGLIIVEGASPKNDWAWAAKADQFAVVDAAGNHYSANGAWADVDQGGQKKFIARYSTNYPLDVIPAGDGKVSNVWLCFPVPAGTEVRQLLLGTDVIGEFPPVKAQSQ